MKKVSTFGIGIGAASVLVLPALAFAQTESFSAVSVFFAESFSLWLAIVVGAVAGGAVLWNAKRVGASLLGRVYVSFGVGILLIVLGLLTVAIPPWATPLLIARAHDTVFILGFGVMASGAGRMLLAAGLK